MSKSKPFAIFIACVGLILLITAIALSVSNGKKVAKQDNANIVTVFPDEPKKVSTDISGYDISGNWYSDRSDSDILTLEKSGEFLSTSWLALGGTYIIDGTNITLTDKTGTKKQVVYKNEGNIIRLEFENNSHSFSYYRTQEEAQRAIEAAEIEHVERQTLVDSAVMQILTTEEWTSYHGDSKLYFTDTEYTIVFTRNDGEIIKREYKYTIDEITEQEGKYKIVWTTERLDDGLKQTIRDVEITVFENKYSISSGSFDFMVLSYSKNVFIEFDQPN